MLIIHIWQSLEFLKIIINLRFTLNWWKYIPMALGLHILSTSKVASVGRKFSTLITPWILIAPVIIKVINLSVLAHIHIHLSWHIIRLLRHIFTFMAYVHSYSRYRLSKYTFAFNDTYSLFMAHNRLLWHIFVFRNIYPSSIAHLWLSQHIASHMAHNRL